MEISLIIYSSILMLIALSCKASQQSRKEISLKREVRKKDKEIDSYKKKLEDLCKY